MEFDFRERMNTIENRVLNACLRSGRDRSDVTVVYVSKTHPNEKIRGYYDLGIRDFGESKVQELSGKMEELPQDINWHMIGHLQTNKVKYIAGKAALIHSVDSMKLAETINKEGLKHDRVIPILLEVNVAEEESKFGLKVHEVLPLVREIAKLSNVQIQGLMTIAPYTEDPEKNRKVFKILRNLTVDISSENIDNVYMNVLSMGMTGDFEVAIEEGATHVRIGTGLFGARDYNQNK